MLGIDEATWNVIQAVYNRISQKENVTQEEFVQKCLCRGAKVWHEELLARSEAEKSVRDIFDHWVKTFAKTRALCTEHRKRAIRARLREGYRAQDLKDAIVGASQSEFHIQNGFTDLQTILRNPSTVDRHLARYRGEISSHHPMGSQAFCETPLHALFDGGGGYHEQ
jgi:hypothetical protein